MACLDDDAQGQPLEVLWEKELDPEILSGESWHTLAAKGFDPPRLFSAYLHAMRWNCVTATNPRLFQAPFRAGIQLHAYQLEPLRKALVLPRVNLFIADDVGLGKTIEAGLIMQEMLLRKRIRDIVVVSPPSVLLQWQDELEARFGLTFEVLDKAYMARVRQERGYSVNPWTTHTRFLVSQRLLIDEAYAGPLRDWLGDFRAGAMMILDEAHNAAPASGARYAIDSKLTRAIRDLSPRFEHRLFLSATPHNGHSNSFSALLEILDPQRFCRGVPVRSKKSLQQVMVRRLKDDLREVAGGFPKRIPVQIDIDGLPEFEPEIALSRLLDEYRNVRSERLKGESKRKQAAASLLISGLQQRLLSSVEAFARTLRVHRNTVLRQWKESQSPSPDHESRAGTLDLLGEGIGNDDDRAALSEEDLLAEEEAQIEAASRATAGSIVSDTAKKLFAREQKLLEEMAHIADAARGLPDAKVRKLVDWIRVHMCPGIPELGMSHPLGAPSPWGDVRIIIFTEYDDTKRYIVQQLSAAIEGTERARERIEVFHGPTPPAKREEIKRAFNEDPRKTPLRILVATDAAREGINLQCQCWNMFHFDVPWNPSRMEQRNGRIDRKLQPRPEVFCHYFVYRQRPEDRILQVLVNKTVTIKKELGSLSPVVEGRLAESLRLGIRHAEVAKLEREIEEADLEAETKQTVAEELEEARERQQALREQIDQLRNRLEESQRWIGLNNDHFRSAISCSLELMGAAALKSVNGGEHDGLPESYAFPALDQRAGADPTWADTMDTLRAPREKDQAPWEWRRKSPIRPVVFDPPDIVTEDVVHLHLEHRVVRRLLGRFSAQGFVHHDLSRACFSQSNDAIPRVVLIGRLCLYGPGAARLHEELLPIAARWIDPTQRKKPLDPYGERGEAVTMNLLEEALLKGKRPMAETVLSQLQNAAPGDITELLPHLEKRGNEFAEEVRKKLAERGRVEADDMREILVRQREQIQKTKTKYDDPQLALDFDTDEQRQLQSNQRHWEKRLTALEHELKREPDRIRALYEVKAQRIEPVGLVYLWPVTG
jgi:superfamily II DNA or RNA helicase